MTEIREPIGTVMISNVSFSYANKIDYTGAKNIMLTSDLHLDTVHFDRIENDWFVTLVATTKWSKFFQTGILKC